MSSLIQIKYGIDSSGNVLNLLVNPINVTSYRSEVNKFYIFLKEVNSPSVLPAFYNFQTRLEFLAATGSTGATGSGNFMESQWNDAIDSSEFLSILDFQSPGFIFSQTTMYTV